MRENAKGARGEREKKRLLRRLGCLTAWTRPRIMRGDLSDLWLTIGKRIKIRRSKQVLKSLACRTGVIFFSFSFKGAWPSEG